MQQSGDVGKVLLNMEAARQTLTDKTLSAERLPEMLYQPSNDGLPFTLPAVHDAAGSPWAEVHPGVFARFTVIQGNLGTNLFEFRITPAAAQTASATPHLSAASFRLTGGATALSRAVPKTSLGWILGIGGLLVPGVGEAEGFAIAVEIADELYITYSEMKAAQALILMAQMNGDGSGFGNPNNTNRQGSAGQFPELDPDNLPGEEKDALNDTLNNIKDGRAQGKNYQNRPTPNQDKLLGEPGDTYTEYDVDPPPGSKTRGPRRIVRNNQSGKEYYTNTHYGDSGAPSFYRLK